MYDLITKTGIFSLRNMISYRIIGSTITEKIGENVLGLDYLIPLFRNTGNIHCISCISYDVISTAILIYIISFHVSGEPTTIKKFDKVQKLGKLRKFVEKTLWIILFVLTKNLENAI